MIPGLAWKVGARGAVGDPRCWCCCGGSSHFGCGAAPPWLRAILCFALLAALSFAVPTDREDEFYPHNYVSKFARSGAVATVDLLTRGIFEADAAVPGRSSLANVAPCERGEQTAAHHHGI